MSRLSFGPRIEADSVIFRLWAPAANEVELLLDRFYPMQAVGGGWYEISVEGARAGTLYKFRIDGEIEVPDPASHYQPHDVSGPSEVIDHAEFRWTAEKWRGRAWADTALLELHVGTFTEEGTFQGVIDKLDHIVESGFTAIELMPVVEFAGERNWGYDGVLWYAPDSAYGRPEDLKVLIDAAHSRGLMVFLDVVYNHFGPEGNYLGRYAPQFFTAVHTPWGSAIDYRRPEVRSFAIENALHWLRHYRFDGLRLDAVHAIVEPGMPSVLEDLSKAVGRLTAESDRFIHLVLENDDNRATFLDPERLRPGKYRAQWNDDYHHAWHVLLTGERFGYYCDYQKDPKAHLARALSSGFAYQGEVSPHRGGRRRGEPSGRLAPTAFVNFIQNHDQIGNRPLGDRLSSHVDSRKLDVAFAITLLAPMPPLMFQGEEWGSERPFPFFCDFQGELAEAVRKGRREEFKSAYAEYGDEIPDPLSEDAFRSAKIDWDVRRQGEHARRLAHVRELLRVRQVEIAPRLSAASFGTARFMNGILIADWRLAGATLLLLANVSDHPARRPAVDSGRPIFGGEPPETLPAWSVFWSIGEAT